MSTEEEIDRRFHDRGHPMALGATYRADGFTWKCTARGFEPYMRAPDAAPEPGWYAELTRGNADEGYVHRRIKAPIHELPKGVERL